MSMQGVMRKARNCLRREVDRSNRMSMTKREKERRRSRQRQLLEIKNANRTVVRIFVQNHQAPYLRTLQDVSDFVTRVAYGSKVKRMMRFAIVSLASELGKANRASSKVL
ncbi:hypothetical protein Scep_024425 [Stephania cephalantha]|uniref:Uncharacterized protein n=1 Tax=Stephania cephalantha TaxID=152367 RepID=A0AAP0HYG1_9MAGN